MGNIQHRIPSAICALALGAAVAAGCGGGGDDSAGSDRSSQASTSSSAAATSTTAAPTTTSAPTNGTDHTTELANGESEGIASQLVDVPGYTYVDPPEAEVNDTLDILSSGAERGLPEVRAASLHSVVADDESQNVSHAASDGSEAGYLKLFEFWESPPVGSERAVVSTMMEIGRAHV